MIEDWKDIPGYGGAYQISPRGEVRSWRYRGEHFAKKPTLLTSYVKSSGTTARRVRFVKLTDATGKAREVALLRLMVLTWYGGCPEGKVPYHKNGDLADHSLHNIGFITRRELGKKTGAKNSRRKPVKKIAPNNEVVAFYPSARAAAKANHMSYQAIIDRCIGRVKKPFALDGFNYQYDV